MKLFYVIVFLFTVSFLFSTTYNTPTIDGTFTEWDTDEDLGTPSNEPTWKMWITWDATYLYFGWEVTAIFPSANDFVVTYLDTQVGGTTGGIASNPETLGLYADICLKVGQTVANSGYYIYDDVSSSWGTINSVTASDLVIIDNNGNAVDTAELRISWATIPNGGTSASQLNLLAIVESNQGSASAAWPSDNTDTANSTYTYAWNETGGEGVAPNGASVIQNPPDGGLPVTLSMFAAVYANDITTLDWLTQSEIDNVGWNIYRSISGNFGQALKINSNFIEGAGTTTEETEYTFIDDTIDPNWGTYYYWLESVDLSGVSELHGPIDIETISDYDNLNPPIIHFNDETFIYSIFPSPFNPSATIGYYLKESAEVVVEVYNLKGQKLRSYHEGFKEGDMRYYVAWDGKDFDGAMATSGIYLFKLTAGKTVSVKKAMLTK
ncbi:MAG: T9SS type A sorting domain-containing protein [Candidatus Cloacimonetes bacterium]|nr:T9SS type A sorting domain-containing protein [Candidatus Cloacimonadota bacterium]